MASRRQGSSVERASERNRRGDTPSIPPWAVAALLFAVAAFAVGLGVHCAGLLSLAARPRPVESDAFPDNPARAEPSSPYAARPLRDVPQGEIIDAEYRFLS